MYFVVCSARRPQARTLPAARIAYSAGMAARTHAARAAFSAHPLQLSRRRLWFDQPPGSPTIPLASKGRRARGWRRRCRRLRIGAGRRRGCRGTGRAGRRARVCWLRERHRRHGRYSGSEAQRHRERTNPADGTDVVHSRSSPDRRVWRDGTLRLSPGRERGFGFPDTRCDSSNRGQPSLRPRRPVDHGIRVAPAPKGRAILRSLDGVAEWTSASSSFGADDLLCRNHFGAVRVRAGWTVTERTLA